jgi:hypothetical protein
LMTCTACKKPRCEFLWLSLSFVNQRLTKFLYIPCIFQQLEYVLHLWMGCTCLAQQSDLRS